MTGLAIVRVIDAPIDAVFDAVTTADAISHWWGPDDGPVLSAQFDCRVGGRFAVRFRTLDGQEHACSGEVLELERPTLVVLSWRWQGQEAEGQSQIRMSLRPIGDRCELVFKHDLLPDEVTAKGHEKGWNGSLDKLQRLLASGREPSKQETP